MTFAPSQPFAKMIPGLIAEDATIGVQAGRWGARAAMPAPGSRMLNRTRDKTRLYTLAGAWG